MKQNKYKKYNKAWEEVQKRVWIDATVINWAGKIAMEHNLTMGKQTQKSTKPLLSPTRQMISKLLSPRSKKPSKKTQTKQSKYSPVKVASVPMLSDTTLMVRQTMAWLKLILFTFLRFLLRIKWLGFLTLIIISLLLIKYTNVRDGILGFVRKFWQ